MQQVDQTGQQQEAISQESRASNNIELELFPVEVAVKVPNQEINIRFHIMIQEIVIENHRIENVVLIM